MSRILLIAAILLGAVYVTWAALVLPGDVPPTALGLVSFFLSMGSITARQQRQPSR